MEFFAENPLILVDNNKPTPPIGLIHLPAVEAAWNTVRAGLITKLLTMGEFEAAKVRLGRGFP